MRKLQLQTLCYIACFSFLFWTLYKQGGIFIQFHIKKFVHLGWTNQKGQPNVTKKGGNLENKRTPLCPNQSTSNDTSDRPKSTHITQSHCRFTLGTSICRTLIETHHNSCARFLTQIIKAKFHIPFIHSSVFTISPTAQAPISPLLQNLATL